MSREGERKRHMGFREEDQEAIATKLKKLSDHRKARSGLGFSEQVDDSHSPPSPTDRMAADVMDDKLEKEHKAQGLKDSIRAIENRKTEAMIRRKQVIANIEGSQEFICMEGSSSVNENDTEHHKKNEKDSYISKRIALGNKKVNCSNAAEDTPLYKRLSVGDTVYAYYAGDGGFHKADIVSVMHGGYHSARYDLKYHGYDEKVTLPWTDLKPFSELRDTDTSPGKYDEGIGQDDVDSFGRSLAGRNLQDISSTTAEMSSQRQVDTSREEANKNACDNFLKEMLVDKHDIASIPNHLNSGEVAVDSDENRVIYEAPVSNLQFSLDGIVDPTFLSGRVKGAWKNIEV